MVRKVLCFALMISLCLGLGACGQGAMDAEEAALAARTRYLEAEEICLTAEITACAETGDRSFTLSCAFRPKGESQLEVLAPESIAGVKASLEADSAVLEYEDLRLELGDLPLTGLSPVEALPALLSALREHPITELGYEESEEGRRCLKLTCDDPTLTGCQQSLWLDGEDFSLLRAEVLAEGRQVLRCHVTEFAWGQETPEP